LLAAIVIGDDQRIRNDRAACKDDDEGEEIERKRQHPEQWHCHNVGRDVPRDRDEQAEGTAPSVTQDAASRRVGAALASPSKATRGSRERISAHALSWTVPRPKA
jgi:hypothetical protein